MQRKPHIHKSNGKWYVHPADDDTVLETAWFCLKYILTDGTDVPVTRESLNDKAKLFAWCLRKKEGQA